MGMRLYESLLVEFSKQMFHGMFPNPTYAGCESHKSLVNGLNGLQPFSLSG